MSSVQNRIKFTVLASIAFAAMMAGLFVSQHIQAKKSIDLSAFHGTLLDNPRHVNPFSLTGTDKKPFDNASLTGQWTMMFFGFTDCGSICPTTMAELAKMYRLLEEKGVKTMPRIVMVSIDPDSDSVMKLKQYVKAFDRHFYGARGSESVIQAMTSEMGVAYEKVARAAVADGKDYDIEHTGTVMLFNPQGNLAAFFTMPHHADLLAADYLLLTA